MTINKVSTRCQWQRTARWPSWNWQQARRWLRRRTKASMTRQAPPPAATRPVKPPQLPKISQRRFITRFNNITIAQCPEHATQTSLVFFCHIYAGVIFWNCACFDQIRLINLLVDFTLPWWLTSQTGYIQFYSPNSLMNLVQVKQPLTPWWTTRGALLQETFGSSVHSLLYSPPSLKPFCSHCANKCFITTTDTHTTTHIRNFNPSYFSGIKNSPC